MGLGSSYGRAQEAVALPEAKAAKAAAMQSFQFVSDGPIGPGWSRPDEIARAYFNESLPEFFSRTVTLEDDIPMRTKVQWLFTGPHAGFTVELSASHVRVFERYYDSMGLYQTGNYPERIVLDVDRPYTGHARTLTVVVDAHLSVKVLVNGVEMLNVACVFDVLHHQMIYAAPRTEHDVVSGALLQPVVKTASIVIKPQEKHQQMLGFGASPSITGYAKLSEEGKTQYWKLLKSYNLLLSREYPMGSELKKDLSNMEDVSYATPHYYGDNLPNGEVSNFEYSKHVIDLGGDVLYELWALPEWANEPYNGPKVLDAWNKSVKKQANIAEYVRIMVGYCEKMKAATGKGPLIVGVQNEVEQPPAVFNEMTTALRAGLDKAGFQSTKIHLADASFMFMAIDRVKNVHADAAAWKATDYTTAHEYDFQEYIANPDMYDARLKALHAASGEIPFLATEICLNDPHYQEASYKLAFQVAQLYHKNLTELDSVTLLYCWLLLDVEQPNFGESRSLMVSDRSRGEIPMASSYQMRVMGAYSRHIRKGMVRVASSSADSDLMTTAFADDKDATLVVVNRGTEAVRIEPKWAGKQWTEMERTSATAENSASRVPASVVVMPGEIVTLSTFANAAVN